MNLPLEVDHFTVGEQALYKGAALQRLATIVVNLGADAAARRIAFRQLALAVSAVPSTSVDVRRALADSLNRRGWETHLQVRYEWIRSSNENCFCIDVTARTINPFRRECTIASKGSLISFFSIPD